MYEVIDIERSRFYIQKEHSTDYTICQIIKKVVWSSPMSETIWETEMCPWDGNPVTYTSKINNPNIRRTQYLYNPDTKKLITRRELKLNRIIDGKSNIHNNV